MSWGKRKEALTKGQAVDDGTDLATLDIPDTFFDPQTQDTPTEETSDTTTDDTVGTTAGTIGPTLCLEGELTGDEDVTIDGTVTDAAGAVAPRANSGVTNTQTGTVCPAAAASTVWSSYPWGTIRWRAGLRIQA